MLPTRVGEHCAKANRPFCLWSKKESGLHINCLEMLAVCQACQFFLPDIRGHHVLVSSESRSVVSYINHQGGLVSKRLCTLANDLLVWAQNNLCSLKATHVPGKMDHGADMLSRNNASSGEWTLHPLAVQKSRWQSLSRPLHLRRQFSLPNLFQKEHGCPGPRVAQSSILSFHSNHSATAGTQRSNGTNSF